MKKKTLSLFLAFVLIVACMPVSARATASNDYTQWKQYDSEWNQSEAWPASQYPNATYRWMKEAGCYVTTIATVYKGNIIKNLIMDCQSYTKYRPNETTGGIFVSWRRKEELPTGA